MVSTEIPGYRTCIRIQSHSSVSPHGHRHPARSAEFYSVTLGIKQRGQKHLGAHMPMSFPALFSSTSQQVICKWTRENGAKCDVVYLCAIWSSADGRPHRPRPAKRVQPQAQAQPRILQGPTEDCDDDSYEIRVYRTSVVPSLKSRTIAKSTPRPIGQPPRIRT